MIVLALLLILGAVALSIGVLMNATGPATLEAFGMSLSTTEGGLFLAGAGAMLALLLGLWLLAVSGKRARRRRSKVQSLERERHGEVERLQEENARLEEAVRHDRNTPPPAASRRHDSPNDTIPGDTIPADRAMPGGEPGSGQHRVDLTDAERSRQAH